MSLLREISELKQRAAHDAELIEELVDERDGATEELNRLIAALAVIKGVWDES